MPDVVSALERAIEGLVDAVAGVAVGWLALGVQVGTAISPLATGALAAVSLPGAFVLSGIMAWVAAALLFFGGRGLLSRRADAPA